MMETVTIRAFLVGMVLLAACGIPAVATAQTLTIRVVTYNIEADISGYTTPRPGLITPSSGGTVTNGGVLEGIGEEIVNGDLAQPIDILALQETTSNGTTVQPIVNGLNAFYGSRTNPAGYARSTYQATSTGGEGGGPNALVYNTNTVQLIASVGVGTPGGSGNGEYRQVVRYEFAPAGATPTTNNEFYIYVSHYKSGTGSTNQNDRTGEAGIIRTNSASLPSNARVLYVGDYNVSTSSETSYQDIVSASLIGIGIQGIDPFNVSDNTSIDWTANSLLSNKTESATILHYRDDFEVMSSNVYYGVTGGLAYVPGTYHTFGNNGTTPYENSVNSGSNTSLNNDLTTNVTGITAAQLYQYLTTASDHLPVVADYTIPSTAPVASFTASPTNGVAPLSVSFTDTSSGSITGWAWAFGDGNTSMSRNPTNIYVTPGTYTVQEIISGLGGVSTDVQPNYIVVNCETYNSTSSSPVGGGSTSGGGTVPCGSNVTVCASANSCYNFVNWTDQNSNVVSTSECYSFTAASNETLVANFAVNGGPISGRLTNLWSFTGGLDGDNPYAGLVQGSDGNFYGTTFGGGTSGNGTVFRIGPAGSLTNLWSFTNDLDGANPSAGLVQGSDGNFYSTTSGSGSGPSGNGTVFRISAGGSLTNLWSFTGGSDGASPQASLVQGSDGNFYGTTFGGGASGNGTVFRISPGGSLTNLWSFTGGSDGAYPLASLVQGSDSNFYGTTYGSGSGPSAYGTVFRISPSGSLTNLWSFTGGSDGASPLASLVQGSDGNFYGTTYGSGSGPSGNGTVFRISPSGGLTNLWEFTGCSDGSYPFAGLVQGSDSNFYGTTSGSGSGASANGSVFQISPSGTLTTLWSFTNGVDGASPYAGLVQGSDGSFYGTTSGSGSGPSGNGTVFKLTVPPNPPPPVASFTATPTNGAAPLNVAFTDTSSNSPTSWSWMFGDTGTSTSQNPSHTYTTPGTYTVTLIASNAVGSSTNTQNNLITALTPPPVAGFTASPTNGPAPLTVNFTNASTGSVTGWTWAFGDGNTSTSQNPSDIYTNPGTYTVQEIASGPGGCSTDAVANLITVYDPFAWWQLGYFGCTNCAQAQAGADPYGKGISNTNQFLLGLNPTNPASVFQIDSLATQGSNRADVLITWTTVGGITNVVQAAGTTGGSGSYATNFIDLSPLIIIQGAGGQITNYLDASGATNSPARYYRIRFQQ